jgi:hypothetical protein
MRYRYLRYVANGRFISAASITGGETTVVSGAGSGLIADDLTLSDLPLARSRASAKDLPSIVAMAVALNFRFIFNGLA